MARRVKPRRTYSTALRRRQAELTRERVVSAARQALVRGVYSKVTIEEIAREAGVAYQTVYALFRTKLGLADAVIAADWPHISAAIAAFDAGTRSADAARWLDGLAAMSRQIYEPCADLMRFLRESGDADLLMRYHEVEKGRFARLAPLRKLLEKTDKLKPAVTAAEAVDMVWALTSPDHYIELVFERGWSAERYQSWLTRTLHDLVLRAARGKGRATA